MYGRDYSNRLHPDVHIKRYYIADRSGKIYWARQTTTIDNRPTDRFKHIAPKLSSTKISMPFFREADPAVWHTCNSIPFFLGDRPWNLAHVFYGPLPTRYRLGFFFFLFLLPDMFFFWGGGILGLRRCKILGEKINKHSSTA